MQDTEGSDECDQCNPGRYRSGTGGNSGNAAGGGEFSCANDGGNTGYRFLDPDQQTNYPGGVIRTTAGDGSGGGACAANCASQDSCIAFMVHANSYCYIYTSDETFASSWNVNADTITYTACEEAGGSQEECAEGTAGAAGSCQPCPPGSYTDSAGQSECTTCEPGRVNTAGTTAQTTCVECDTGRYRAGEGGTGAASSGQCITW